ncbi:ferrochelatase [Budviciaceae bacterium BWR-B9]|uniref:Ferrochelatase n=1 Tax=Limnobaculum allomyrinae TaxID=2791986 RepID=A0ABS1IMF4_9GAMM|nr:MULTISPECIES: ferrochelatase [Limnobaculum]MBK5142929.1 ferrochelatase [Limnobaculum allomyrinae]MBV7690184.1 ferrochelatase [Limnobaculum sp. M2-1]
MSSELITDLTDSSLNRPKTGILLVNLGTPDAPTAAAVKRYLTQFLQDRRVVDLNPLVWAFILKGIILPRRAPRVAKLYHEVWMEEGSPLLVYSQRQQRALAARLPQVPVELAMTYGSPSVKQALDRLQSQNIKRLVVLPLYPQYSCSTTAAAWDALSAELANRRDLPEISFIRDYAAHPLYIEALARSIQVSFELYGKPDLLLFSYHGIPQRYADEGDDYPQRCEATTAGVVAALGLEPSQYKMTYQSRFGREVWLQPYTDETMRSLPSQGVKSIQVICPGFASDCLETIEEIEQQNRAFFMENGGESYHYIPALNDSADQIDLFQALVTERGL